MDKSIQELLEEATSTIKTQRQRIEYLETVLYGVTRLLENVKAYEIKQAAAVQAEPVQWVQVVQVEADSFFSKTTNSRRGMWRLLTDDGRQANVFDHSDPLRDSKPMLTAAGYMDIFDGMVAGQLDTWKGAPIEVELVADGTWWKVKQVKPRDDNAWPDVKYDEPLDFEDEL